LSVGQTETPTEVTMKGPRLLLASFLASAFAQNQLNSCRTELQSLGVSTLTQDSFNVLIQTLSGGTVLTAPLIEVDLSGLNGAVEESAGIDTFCDQVYTAIVTELGIAVDSTSCIGALQQSDKNPTNGRLNAVEFVVFVSALANGEGAQEVFDDFANQNGEVSGSKGIDFLMSFCQRTVLSVFIASNGGPVAPLTGAPIQTPVLVTAPPVVAPTSAPITPPTSVPTSSPISMPTLTPIAAPVAAPVAVPVAIPMEVPVMAPVAVPVDIPVEIPVNEPTAAPMETPVTSPVEVAPTVDISEKDFTSCAGALSNVDSNGNFLLETTEYLAYVQPYLVESVNEFEDLPFSLRLAFREVSGSNDSVDIAGTQPTPTTEATFSLKTTCVVLLRGISDYLQTVETSALTTSCRDALEGVDQNGDGFVDYEEYVALANTLSKSPFPMTTESIPFLVAQNFRRLTNGDGEQYPLESLETNLGAAQGFLVCESTNRIMSHPDINSPDVAVTLMDQCSRSAARADVTGDGRLSLEEFFSFFDEMSAFALSGESSSVSTKQVTDLYTLLKDDSMDGVSIAGRRDTAASEEKSHFESICSSIETSSKTIQSDDAFFNTCRVSLIAANEDGNERLSRDEYVTFMYTVTNTPFPAGINYDGLSDVVRINYNLLALREQEVSIKELRYPLAIGSTETDRIRWICSKVEEVSSLSLASSDSSKTVTVYNSFLVRGPSLIRSALESGDERAALNNAFAVFVASQLTKLTASRSRLRARKRWLRIEGLVTNSVELYDLHDAPCATDSATESCVALFWSFEMEYTEETSPKELSDAVSGSIQTAIGDGELQVILIEQHPELNLTIAGVADTLTPENITPDTSRPPLPANKDEKSGGSTLLAAILGCVGGMLLGAGIWHCYVRRRNTLATKSEERLSDHIDFEPERAPDDRGLASKTFDNVGTFNVQQEDNELPTPATNTFGSFVATDAPAQGETEGDGFGSFGGFHSDTKNGTGNASSLFDTTSSDTWDVQGKQWDNVNSSLTSQPDGTIAASNAQNETSVTNQESIQRSKRRSSNNDKSKRGHRSHRDRKRSSDRHSSRGERNPDRSRSGRSRSGHSRSERSRSGRTSSSSRDGDRDRKHRRSSHDRDRNRHRSDRRRDSKGDLHESQNSFVEVTVRSDNDESNINEQKVQTQYVDPSTDASVDTQEYPSSVEPEDDEETIEEIMEEELVDDLASADTSTAEIELHDVQSQVSELGTAYTEDGADDDDEIATVDDDDENSSDDDALTLDTFDGEKFEGEGSEDDGDEDDTIDASESSHAHESQQNNHRAQIESLMRAVMPQELDNIDAMMEQFEGREEELIGTLENMATGGIALDEDDESDAETDDADTIDDDSEATSVAESTATSVAESADTSAAESDEEESDEEESEEESEDEEEESDEEEEESDEDEEESEEESEEGESSEEDDSDDSDSS